MTDDIDRAQEREQIDRDAAIAAHHRQHPTPRARTIGARWCECCGDEIPIERQRAVPHTSLCIDCQVDRERR